MARARDWPWQERADLSVNKGRQVVTNRYMFQV